MLPPPRVGGIEFSSGAVGSGDSANATPISPMNGLSGNVTLPPAMTPRRPADRREHGDVAVPLRIAGRPAVRLDRRHDLVHRDPGRDATAREPGERALAVPARHHAVRHPREHRQHLDLEYVARRGAGDEDRAGDDVRTVDVEVPRRTVVVAGDGDRVLQHRRLADAVPGEVPDRVASLVLEDALVRDGVDGDRLPGPHAQYGVAADRRHVAPADLVRRRPQIVTPVDRAFARLQHFPGSCGTRRTGRHD